jgi:cytochrome c-type biogenesis protein CcmH/NrfG
MTKISLRAYNREIEKLIDHGQTEEASAHCKYILKLFPKHIDTYRLLGKAYLESQRYSEAADILQRVLAVIPDDFVSQIGLSIIREDEGNLDAAIWNMERAFEVQPSNAAVQDELRRLYGSRDGVEPPRVRLTRGALVRMYTRGELYQQAIAEARAAIAEDPKRIDLEILLARNYYLSKNFVEATEICSRLVKRLPYCYEANWILSEILPSTNKADEAKIFANRVHELDPYAAFTDRSTPTSTQVPDDAVTLERLDWQPSLESKEQPQWAKSIGIDIGEDSEQLASDWLNELPAEDEAPAAPMPFIVPEVSESKSEEILPDWMKENGWSQGGDATSFDAAQHKDAFIFDENEPLEEAEIPEWLQSMAPEEKDQGQPPEKAATPFGGQPKDESGIPEWMMDLDQGGVENEPAEPEESATFTPPPAANQAEELPDWMQDFDTGLQAQPTDTGTPEEIGTPDWLEGAGDEEAESPVEKASPEETPDWLKGLEATSLAAAIAAEETAAPPVPEDEGDVEEITPASDIPDWLKDLETSAAKGSTELPDLSETPVAKEQTLPGADTGFIPESVEPQDLSSPPMEATESLPDWLKEFEAAEETQTPFPSAEAPEAEAAGPQEEIPDWLKEFGEDITPAAGSASDQEPEQPFEQVQAEDEAEIPWLVGFKADQETTMDLSKELEGKEFPGSLESEEIPEPAQELPDWLKDMEAEETSQAEPAANMPSPVQETPEPAMPEQEEGDIDEAFAWLESLAAKHGAEEEALSTPPDERDTSVPDWLQELGEGPGESEPSLEEEAAQTEAEQPLQQAEGGPPDWMLDEEFEEEIGEAALPLAAAAEELPDWLKDLGQEEPTPVSKQTSPLDHATEREEEPPLAEAAAETAESGLPDWLKAEEEAAGVAPAVPTEEIPDWLEPQPESAEVLPQAEPADELPDWLKDLEKEEPAAPLVTAKPEQPEAGDQVEAPPAQEMPGLAEEEDAFAWLEALAARHGADEEALVTSAEERRETPPEWIQELEPEEPEAEHLPQAEQAEPQAETLPISNLDTGVDLLGADVAQPPVAEETQVMDEKEAKAREWLQSLASGKPIPRDVPETEQPESEMPELGELELPAEGTPPEMEDIMAELLSEAETEGESPTVAESPIAELEAEAALPDWLKEFEETPDVEPVAEVQPEELEVDEGSDETVIRWLHAMDEKQAAPTEEAVAQPETPAPIFEIEEPELPAVEEQPAAEIELVVEPVPEPVIEEEPVAEIAVEQIEPEPPAEAALVTEAAGRDGALRLLNDGKIEEAINIYETLIKEEEQLDTVIEDLNAALYRHPVDTLLWLALGDAYMQKREMQNALSAYTKAEELLR